MLLTGYCEDLAKSQPTKMIAFDAKGLEEFIKGKLWSTQLGNLLERNFDRLYGEFLSDDTKGALLALLKGEVFNQDFLKPLEDIGFVVKEDGQPRLAVGLSESYLRQYMRVLK